MASDVSAPFKNTVTFFPWERKAIRQGEMPSDLVDRYCHLFIMCCDPGYGTGRRNTTICCRGVHEHRTAAGIRCA